VSEPASPAFGPAGPAGLFDRRRAAEASGTRSELHALLDLPPTTPKRDADEGAEQAGIGASAAPAWKRRVEREMRRESRFAWLKTLGLALLAMAVVLIAGGIALSAQRSRPAASSVPPAQAAAPAPAVTPAPAAPTAPVPVANAPAVAQAAMALPAALPAQIAPRQESVTPADTWVVQVGAFSHHDRSQSLVQRLTHTGFSAFEVPTDASRGPLYLVRVGPFTTASEADAARARLRGLTELENAFVRNVTSVP
jgi:cell division septation protein DedD